ncbi:polyphosphate polymerase domain-containing protein [Gaoshiqia sp. Z1-71]|uniref:polyphosphate polymerase domain-containing protein n=1 Tax=Gaoshiqia hydrogeniformans TaxID=3290090 RepID=UPI003BF84E16
MDVVRLADLPKNDQMNRYDKKFVFRVALVPDLLKKAGDAYAILESNGTRIFSYYSDYFDSPDYKMYVHHHNGKKNRYKVRIREYLNSGDKFLELKHKNNRSFTTKKRMPYTDGFPLTDEADAFIKNQSTFDPEDLIYTLSTRYQRITLVNKQKSERITIDFNLHLNTAGKQVKLENLAIAEIKNNDRHLRSPFNQFLKSHQIRQESFSKYCIGMALLNLEVKNNLFKEKILKIKKIEHEPIDCYSQSSL